MKLKNKLLIIQALISLLLFFPSLSFAHLISITATAPFPAEVFTSSTSTATFTVTNITSKTPLTIVSTLPNPFSVVSSTCGVLIGPGKSCTTTAKFVAPDSPAVISSHFKAVGQPSLDGVQIPIQINVIKQQQSARVTVTLSSHSAFQHGTFNIINTLSGSGTNTLSATLPSGMSFIGANSCSVSATVPSCSLTVNTGGIALGNYTIIPKLTSGSASVVSSPNPLSIAVSTAAILTVVGGTITANTPFVLASTDLGSSWSIQNISNLPPNGQFFGGSCTGSGSTAICVAAGGDPTFNVEAPLLAVSITGGSSWSMPTVTNLPTTAEFRAASCTGSGLTGICIAAGFQLFPSADADPLVAVSQNGGRNWSVQPTGVTDGNLSAASCTGSGSTAVCIVAGDDSSNFTEKALVIASTDGGGSWAFQTTGLTAIGGGPLNAASCTGSGSTAICVAAGGIDQNGPCVASSIDGASTWVPMVFLAPTAANGTFQGASCTGSGSNAVCVLAGITDTSTLSRGYIVVGSVSNAQMVWNDPLPPLAPVSHTTAGYLGASCTGSGSSAVCVAVGGDINGSTLPFIAVSTNGGASWTAKSSITNNGYLSSVSCIPNGSANICIATGADATAGIPLLVMSTDNGGTWNVVNNITGLPSDSVFNGTAGANASIALKSPFHSKKFGVQNKLNELISNK